MHNVSLIHVRVGIFRIVFYVRSGWPNQELYTTTKSAWKFMQVFKSARILLSQMVIFEQKETTLETCCLRKGCQKRRWKRKQPLCSSYHWHNCNYFSSFSPYPCFFSERSVSKHSSPTVMADTAQATGGQVNHISYLYYMHCLIQITLNCCIMIGWVAFFVSS